MSGFVFRPLRDEEVSAAYEILRGRSVWLESRGIWQESELFPLADFEKRQEQKQNLGVFSSGLLVATVCLKREPTVKEYAPFMEPGEHWWIYALASHTMHSGGGLGRETMRLAEAHLRSNGVTHAYLECGTGTGFLPRFYASQGWHPLGKIMSDEGFAELVEMNLFAKRL